MLVSKPKGFVDGTPAPTGATEERVVVDIFGSEAIEGHTAKLDTKVDAWERIAPPAEGRYSLKLFPSEGKEKCVSINYKTGRGGQKVLENGQPVFESYSINIESRIVSDNEDSNNVPVFASVSTRIGRGKSISTAAGLLVKLGYGDKLNPDKEYSDKAIAKAVVMALLKEPVIPNNWLDWKYGYRGKDGRWKSVFRTMADFPVDEEGEYIANPTITTDSGSREEVFAKLYVREWGGVGSTQAKPVEAVVVEEEAAPAPKAAPVATPKKKTTPAPAPPVEELTEQDEEELVL